MTYCVAMCLDDGPVFLSDSRTNAGVDAISTFRKMFRWQQPDERIIVLMTAGNLATTQAVISQLEERNKAPDQRHNTLFEAPTMFQVAVEVGRLLRDTIQTSQCDNGQEGEGRFTASMILAGQIKGMQPRLFMLYPEGNFIEASPDTPFFQIGETKYGRPILLRGYEHDMEFEDAVKLLMVSFDSTLKANLSVGMPLDLLVIEKDRFEPFHEKRIDKADLYFQAISSMWGDSLKEAVHALPEYSFSD